VTLQATAGDDVGVAGVRFQLDGEDLGAEVAAAPYVATFNASDLPSGQHVVRARARDAAGKVSPWSTVVLSVAGGAVPAGFTRTSPWVFGLSSATAMAFAPDGRLFVCEQGGAIRIIENGFLLPAPFALVPTAANGERGLLGIALHPDFPAVPHVFVHYTALVPNPHNRISRFTAAGNGAAGGETVLVDLPDLGSATNHNGGAIHFGPDGRLYVGVGENANASQAQSLANPFGKLLRFNADGSIPSDNPFFGSTTGLARAIWATGLRNPFTFAFQPGTGRLHINDVGQGSWEEVNLGAAGANYGWPLSEGPTSAAGQTGPLFAYGHPSLPAGQPQSTGTFLRGISVVGAAFYNPPVQAFPAAMAGHYFFADYTGNWIARMDPANGNAVYTFATVPHVQVDLAVGPDGALYALGRDRITRISRP
jgi:glucose/arabinose dehydrogenase